MPGRNDLSSPVGAETVHQRIDHEDCPDPEEGPTEGVGRVVPPETDHAHHHRHDDHGPEQIEHRSGSSANRQRESGCHRAHRCHVARREGEDTLESPADEWLEDELYEEDAEEGTGHTRDGARPVGPNSEESGQEAASDQDGRGPEPADPVVEIGSRRGPDLVEAGTVEEVRGRMEAEEDGTDAEDGEQPQADDELTSAGQPSSSNQSTVARSPSASCTGTMPGNREVKRDSSACESRTAAARAPTC